MAILSYRLGLGLYYFAVPLFMAKQNFAFPLLLGFHFFGAGLILAAIQSGEIRPT